MRWTAGAAGRRGDSNPMDTIESLRTVCAAIGLRCDVKYTQVEPRFSVVVVADNEGPRLRVRMRADGSVAAIVLDHIADPPGMLLEIQEETVQREPVLDLWLPYSARHLHLVHRSSGGWVVERLPGLSSVATVDEARALLKRRRAAQA